MNIDQKIEKLKWKRISLQSEIQKINIEIELLTKQKTLKYLMGKETKPFSF